MTQHCMEIAIVPASDAATPARGGPEPDARSTPSIAEAELEARIAPAVVPTGDHVEEEEDDDETARRPEVPRFRFGPWTLLSVAVASLVAAFMMADVDTVGRLAVLFCLGAAAAGWGMARAIAMLVAGKLSVSSAVSAVLANAIVLRQGIAALDLLWIPNSGGRGRQLRRRGRVLLPPVRQDGSWTRASLDPGDAGPLREALAAQWRENGRTEHASVGAFARLTLELMALGAPPSLVEAANRDGRDEIRHAELCFSLARALDGSEQGPGPFPEAERARPLPRSRTGAFAQLAIDALVDGAFHEGVSARLIAELRERCPDPPIRSVLKELAVDEGRHTAHGWDVVAWCLAEGGEPVARALRAAVRRIPVADAPSVPEAARDGSWEAWGIPGAALHRAQYRAAWRQVAQRVATMTAPWTAGPAR